GDLGGEPTTGASRIEEVADTALAGSRGGAGLGAGREHGEAGMGDDLALVHRDHLVRVLRGDLSQQLLAMLRGVDGVVEQPLVHAGKLPDPGDARDVLGEHLAQFEALGAARPGSDLVHCPGAAAAGVAARISALGTWRASAAVRPVASR